MESGNKGPLNKSKIGRFQVSLWKRDKFIPPRHGYDAGRTVVVRSACVQYSRWNRETSKWENQSIWCNWDELRDLVQALEGIAPLVPLEAVPAVR